jgi:conjugal transfer pilus assembly protein TraK
MANLRPGSLQPLLTLTLLISTTPAPALQTIEARDGVSVEASIALKEATRIKVDGERITEVFGNIYSSNCGGVAAVNRDAGQPLAAINPTGEIVLECDKDKGEIYVKPVAAGAKPVNLFISTARSTYTLILKRVDMPADTIVLKDRVLQQAAARLERSGGTSPSHVRALKQMLTAMASDRVGVDVRVEEVNRPVQLWAESRFTLLRLYEGRGLIGEKYLLTNISNEPMVLAEQEFDREQGDVIGVSIESHNLRPGESTNVFVLRQRN